MKRIRIISILLALILLASMLLQCVFAAEEPTAEPTEVPWADDPTGYRENQLGGQPDYQAGSHTALLLELNSGIVVYAKNAEERVFPASLTKVMTCLVALKYAGDMLDSLHVTVSEEALAGIAEAGGEIRLKVGEQMTLRNALYYLMVVSSNESANVVAEAVGGDIPSFVNMMNQTAREIGCTDTHFANTHGLHDANHYTTARDLSVIVRAALTYGTFREIVATAEYTVPATNLSDATRLTTTNYLILNDGNRYLADNGNYYTYYYDKASGIKTGYTSAAGRCVISRATDGNMDLLCVIMGADTRLMEDGSTRYDNFVEAKKLFNYGFDNFAYAKLASSEECFPAIKATVKYGDDNRGVVLVPAGDVNCLLPKDYDPSQVGWYETYDNNALVADLKKGQKVGTLTMTYDGKPAGSTDLITLTAVSANKVDKVIDKVTGNDKPYAERTTMQKILHYWYVPLVILVSLFFLLVIRNLIYRAWRRREVRIRRQRETGRKRGRSDAKDGYRR